MNLEFLPKALNVYKRVKERDTGCADRIKALLKDILEHPESGIGAPMQLQGKYAGVWVRKISFEDSLYYVFDTETIVILSIFMRPDRMRDAEGPASDVDGLNIGRCFSSGVRLFQGTTNARIYKLKGGTYNCQMIDQKPAYGKDGKLLLDELNPEAKYRNIPLHQAIIISGLVYNREETVGRRQDTQPYETYRESQLHSRFRGRRKDDTRFRQPDGHRKERLLAGCRVERGAALQIFIEPLYL